MTAFTDESEFVPNFVSFAIQELPFENITYSLSLLMFVIQTATSSPSYPQKLANQLVTYENTGREIPAFFSEANEPLVLFICGLIILLIATGLKSGLARKPS